MCARCTQRAEKRGRRPPRAGHSPQGGPATAARRPTQIHREGAEHTKSGEERAAAATSGPFADRRARDGGTAADTATQDSIGAAGEHPKRSGGCAQAKKRRRRLRGGRRPRRGRHPPRQGAKERKGVVAVWARGGIHPASPKGHGAEFHS